MARKRPNLPPGAAADQLVRPTPSGVRRRFSGPIPRLDAPVVLVVDDDLGIRMTFERILLRAGFVPLCCSDPTVAVQRCVAERPALVITDYSMPQMTGIELADEILAALGSEAPPMILVTGHAIRELPPSRTNLTLPKPVSPQDLVAAVQLLLPEQSSASER